MRQAVQRPHQDAHGILKAWFPSLGDRSVSGHDELEGRVEYEAASRSRDHPASAWFLAHRLREAWKDHGTEFAGPVEVDETYIGGKRKNMSKAKRKEMAGTGRGAVGKAVVVGARDRATNKVSATMVRGTDMASLQGFIAARAAAGAKVYTDEHSGYKEMSFDHETVNHSAGEYVRGMAHTNGIESFWATLKRAHKGTFHHFSVKHLDRYVTEFAGRHNVRDADTVDQMAAMVRGFEGLRLSYQALTAK